MIVLGIETSTAQVGVAIGDNDGVVASLHSSRGRRHAETLTPAVQAVCAQAEVSLREVGAIAVDIGPGLFTGLRVGIATAKAMANALGIGVIGLTSLDLLAFSVRHSERLIVPVVDARRGEVFWAPYRQVPGGVQKMSGESISKPDVLASELWARAEEALLVGDGARRYAASLGAPSRVELDTYLRAYPTASALVELAHPRALREEFVSPGEVSALYLRRPDAAINWEQRRGRPTRLSGGADRSH